MAITRNILVADDDGPMVVVTYDDHGRVGEEVTADVGYRDSLEHTTFAAQMLSVCVGLPDVHPMVKAKLLSLLEVVAFYVPKENGGKMTDLERRKQEHRDGGGEMPF